MPGYFQMVLRYGKGSMAQVLGTAIDYARNCESVRRGGDMRSEDLVLVGHSAGGGISQLYLSRSMGQVGGLVLLASFPNFGA
jgi:alpha-beta hydrolase superfamily lysophospholipase